MWGGGGERKREKVWVNHGGLDRIRIYGKSVNAKMSG